MWFSSVQSLSCVRLFVTPWTAPHQASLSPPSMVYPSSWWLCWRCHLTVSSSVTLFCLQTQDQGLYQWVSSLHQVAKLLELQHQFSSVEQLCLILCDPMDCSMPALPVHHQLPEFTQTHVNWVSDAIQPSHPLSSPSPIAFNLSQHQGLFQWVCSSHQVARVLELQHQTFQWIFRIDFFKDWLVGSPCSPRDSQEFSNTTVQKHQFFSAQLSWWSNSHIHIWLLGIP